MPATQVSKQKCALCEVRTGDCTRVYRRHHPSHTQGRVADVAMLLASTMFVRALSTGPTAPPIVRTATHALKFLALTIDDGKEIYRVRASADDAHWKSGTLLHDTDQQWMLAIGDDCSPLELGSPDDVFLAAAGAPSPSLRAAVPFWPESYVSDLERRRLSGSGTIAFDASTFLELLATSPVDRPLLLPDAATKLGLEGLRRASGLLGSVATTLRCGRVDVSSNAFAEMLLRVERAERAVIALAALDAARSGAAGAAAVERWEGRGRLITRWPDGELAQLGTDVCDGVRLALGRGVHRVTFSADEPLGVGFGPLALGAGTGAEVGEVDAGSAAARLGVEVSMVLLAIEDLPSSESPPGTSREDAPPPVPSTADDLSRLTEIPFEHILRAIDERRDAGMPLTLVFDTAAPASHLYAVEMPAARLFGALAASEARTDTWHADDVDADGLMAERLHESGQPPALWSEGLAKAFVGDRGSVTCAHVDIAPDLELAHQLHGVKFLGVATHDATPRLLDDHAPEPCGGDDGDDGDDGDEIDDVVATSVPTDRPLRFHESALLGDEAMSIACLLPGDLCVFSSAALHFASNGADDLNAAIYHGVLTQAALPRLREAARQGSSGDDEQLSAADVLAEVEQQHGE